VRGQHYAPAALYPREGPSTHCTGGWVGPRAGLYRCGKSCPTRIQSPDHPAYSQSLYRLHYLAHIIYSTPQYNFYTYLLTPWSRVLLEKLTSKLVKKFPAFMEPESPSPYPQVPATCLYPEPTPSSPHDPLKLPEDPS
jgi:hypothetical protein